MSVTLWLVFSKKPWKLAALKSWMLATGLLLFLMYQSLKNFQEKRSIDWCYYTFTGWELQWWNFQTWASVSAEQINLAHSNFMYFMLKSYSHCKCPPHRKLLCEGYSQFLGNIKITILTAFKERKKYLFLSLWVLCCLWNY